MLDFVVGDYLMFLWIMIFKYNFLQKEEGIKLVCEAICSGIFNDLGSGSNVDVCVITKVCGLIFFFVWSFLSLNLDQCH